MDIIDRLNAAKSSLSPDNQLVVDEAVAVLSAGAGGPNHNALTWRLYQIGRDVPAVGGVLVEAAGAIEALPQAGPPKPSAPGLEPVEYPPDDSTTPPDPSAATGDEAA